MDRVGPGRRMGRRLGRRLAHPGRKANPPAVSPGSPGFRALGCQHSAQGGKSPGQDLNLCMELAFSAKTLGSLPFRLLGHSWAGALPEHACFLLPQGPRLHHGKEVGGPPVLEGGTLRKGQGWLLGRGWVGVLFLPPLYLCCLPTDRGRTSVQDRILQHDVCSTVGICTPRSTPAFLSFEICKFLGCIITEPI